jgi:hypothetical protein
MTKFSVIPDEWYPVLVVRRDFITHRPRPLPQRDEIELSQPEIEDLWRVSEEFKAWQKRLGTLIEAHNFWPGEMFEGYFEEDHK